MVFMATLAKVTPLLLVIIAHIIWGVVRRVPRPPLMNMIIYLFLLSQPLLVKL